MLQITDQVRLVLDTDRQTDQPILDTDRFPYIGRNRRMGHDGRMFDQAFDATKAFRQREYAATGQHGSGSFQTTSDDG